ncbi:MAG: transcription-repair coupling factor [Bacteroidaceae bacterium]|nr:transcription-repair coupling factor [Bacteroidaceae bacterium]
MDIKELRERYTKHPKVKKLQQALLNDEAWAVQVTGLQASATALAFASLSDVPPLLFVLDDADEAGYFYHDMVQLLGDERVLFFPSSFRRAVKFGQRDAANEILRTEVLARIGAGSTEQLFIVSHPEAVAERVVTREKMQQNTLALHKGEHVDIAFVEQTLLEFGFQRTDYVYEPGQFAVRGSLVDVFSYANEYPFRIDFFGNEIDSIRSFEVETQLSRERKTEIVLVPALDDSEGTRVTLTSLLPSNTVIVCKSPTYVADSIDQAYKQGFARQTLIEEQAVAGQQVLKIDDWLVDGATWQEAAGGFRQLWFSQSLDRKPKVKIEFNITPQPVFHKNFDLLQAAIQNCIQLGQDIFILADSQKQIERIAAIVESWKDGEQMRAALKPISKTLHAGFTDNTLGICLLTDHQIFDRFHKYSLRSERARGGKVALTLKELQEFNIGDYIVHIDHGIGRFGGLVHVPQQNGTMQEMIKLIYERDDVVYVSIHALHKVSKYKGKEGEPPRISRLGTGAWERMKERTKTKIKDIARDLIRLYAQRREQQGFKFSPDSYLQHELEASFLYEDTPDQLRATADVKADMEKRRPMDRLVCGDVGFGKTEVAVRAAFKAAADSKQVAVLVPTTILAYQHYHTFSDRLRDLPVRVDYLTRARSPKQTRELLADLEAGRIDILVGTHKLIGKNVKFKDLGLLIIDEEQKFGVATKEKLRQMKVNVDTLTLTATPIPRTLQFSLMGARDLSVIQTPPPNRYPIQTEVHSFSPEVIAEAVRFEMSRNGQVFIVSNRISSLPDLEAIIHRYVPDARVATGHGRMASDQLEQVMMDFAAYDYDVLISTTIIESGLDIPNANTIIICSAHQFGLSDLHQMRGRVGRSNKKAFCYLLAPPLGGLPPEARRRLQAIENFSDLGSGIHIAMQDLDIRGAGNLLGSEQSGFIADLGYETYQKILSEAVKELKNDEFKDLYAEQVQSGEITSGDAFVDECLLESDLPMFFADTYVPTASERMLLYRELDQLERPEAVEAFRQRMTDRFGTIPLEGEELIRVVELRQLGKYFGAERIILKNHRMRLYFVNDPSSPFFQSPAFDQVIAYYSLHAANCQLEEVNNRRSMLIRDICSVKQACDTLQQMKAGTTVN